MSEHVTLDAATFRFSPANLDDAVSEIQRDLAELDYIDRALDHLSGLEEG